ncbi:hypothetical protein BGZ82_005260 [Podila clonocystis]|nr:hypothetical protein BGZ82_005260 [Podila clonocystis]
MAIHDTTLPTRTTPQDLTTLNTLTTLTTLRLVRAQRQSMEGPTRALMDTERPTDMNVLRIEGIQTAIQDRTEKENEEVKAIAIMGMSNTTEEEVITLLEDREEEDHITSRALSYESDLHEKEQDLIEARKLLHGIQAEVQEGQHSVEEWKAKTAKQAKAEVQIRRLEELVRQEVQVRQRLRMEEVVVQEEVRLKEQERYYREREREQRRPIESLAPEQGVARCVALENEGAELRSRLGQLQERRKEQVQELVQLKGGHGKRQHEYKRLIALCCNVAIDEVDGLLGPLLAAMNAENAE